MRTMRLLAFLLLLSALLALLAGCGSGSGSGSGSSVNVGQRTVTVTLRWPSDGKKVSRASIKAVQSATVEVYDGKTSVARIFLTNTNGTPQTTQQLTLPAKTLTFYANGYAQTNDLGYITDPATGQPAKGSPGAYVPLAPGDANGNSSDAHPLAHAVTVADVPKEPNITFTLNNTIATLTAVQTTLSLDNPNVDLYNIVQGRSSDNATVLIAPGSLQAINDPADTLGQVRAGFFPGTTTLHLNVSGTVRVIVTDREVNSSDPTYNQIPLTSAVTYTILPHATQPVLTLNANPGSSLLAGLPFYAKSVTFTLTQTALVDPGSGGILDNPPLPVSVTSPITFNPANNTISVNNPLPLTLISSGRNVTLRVQAWSKNNGTGVLLAEGQTPLNVSALPSANAPVEVSPNSNVTGFALTPVNPVITINSTSTSFGGAGVNTQQLQISALVPGNDPTAGPIQTVPIDPRTVSFDAVDPAIVVLTIPTAPTDANNNPYILLTAVVVGNGPVVTSRQTTITARDRQHTATIFGQATLTVQRANPGFTFD